jgi:hypothetical protein
VRDTVWVKAILESIHILADGVLVFSAAMIFARSVGFTRSGTAADLARRLGPWRWGAFAVAAVTGLMLLTGAGRRGLDNPVFKIKLIAIVVAVTATALIQWPSRIDHGFWSHGAGRRVGGALVGLACLAAWLTTVFAGRLLAYSTAFFAQ